MSKLTGCRFCGIGTPAGIPAKTVCGFILCEECWLMVLHIARTAIDGRPCGDCGTHMPDALHCHRCDVDVM